MLAKYRPRVVKMDRAMRIMVSVQSIKQCMISGLRCKGDENRAVLGYYTASSVNVLTTFQEILLVPSVGCDAVSLGKYPRVFKGL
jgi:hypothetical protein